MERTFIMIKPDAVQRNLAGAIIKRIEDKGFKIAAMKMVLLAKAQAEKHYQEHTDKPFFADLVAFITSGPVIAMVIEGKNVVETMRKIIGETNPAKAATGTIRGDLGIDVGRNIIHGSDSPESAAREVNLYFKPEEIVGYEKTVEQWIYE